MNCFNDFVLRSTRRVAMPIAVYPGITLTKARVQDGVNNPHAQAEATVTLHERYQTAFVLSAMDLSVEAEAFGCTIRFHENEVPSVLGRLVTNLDEAQRLAIPKPGDQRTAVYLEVVQRLRSLPDRPLVLAGSIGPFSLAARLVGVSEAMELTVTDPELMHLLIEKSTAFLTDYLKAFRAAGADGVIMAEPAAGLLSPRSMAAHSSAYIRRIRDSLSDDRFAFILHNCAAKVVHLPALLETGLTTFHFGAPMDLEAALAKVPPEVVVCGNLDPAGVFCHLRPEEVAERTSSVLAATAQYRNYVLSSGCDIPANAPLENLDAFFESAKSREG